MFQARPLWYLMKLAITYKLPSIHLYTLHYCLLNHLVINHLITISSIFKNFLEIICRLNILSLQRHLNFRIKYQNLGTEHFTLKCKQKDENSRQKRIKAIFAKVTQFSATNVIFLNFWQLLCCN